MQVEWVPCKERMPSEFQHVWIKVRGITSRVTEGYWEWRHSSHKRRAKIWFEHGSNWLHRPLVTHWAEIAWPEPPTLAKRSPEFKKLSFNQAVAARASLGMALCHLVDAATSLESGVPCEDCKQLRQIITYVDCATSLAREAEKGLGEWPEPPAGDLDKQSIEGDNNVNWRERLKRLRERALRWFVWRLPRPLIYWSAIRLVAAATTGKYSDVSVPDLTAMDALKAWEPCGWWERTQVSR